MKQDNTTEAFFALVRAGLWEKDIQLLPYGEVDYEELMRLAQEQSVVGLVTAGLEHVVDVVPPTETVLKLVGQTLQIEQRNKAMDSFIGDVVERMREKGIYTLLVKGQGIARCYERPLWRESGDIDLLLSSDNYQKAFDFLVPLATKVDREKEYTKHQALSISGWEVELHGTLRSGLWRKFERTIDEVQKAVFYRGCVRSWLNGKTQIFLPDVNEDVFFVFSHILQHFFKGGIGLRQVCDWCRLLWKYRESLNHALLEKHLNAAGTMTEWKAFGAFAVVYLGMPGEAVPFYSSLVKWRNKAGKILSYILETGNFGHNRDVSYQNNTPVLLRKFITMWRQTLDNAIHFWIFPLDSLKAWLSILIAGVKDMLKRE